MTGVTTRHPEEPYANNASTVPWEVLGATRAPTRLGFSVSRLQRWAFLFSAYSAGVGCCALTALCCCALAALGCYESHPGSWLLVAGYFLIPVRIF